MLRTLSFGSLAATLGLAAITLWRPTHAPAQVANTVSNKAAAPALPLSHVALFSSGVGYFQRQGDIDGNAKVDLAFPATDINDLIKSLVLEDTGGGKIVAINYDSQDPIERTLRTFALDLTSNPSLGDLLNQARGERVEATMQSPGQSGTLMGTILGMESQRQQPGKDQIVDIDVLNLLTAEGLRSVPLAQVQRVRFLNPTLDGELKRALEIIAGARNHQKKSVSLSFRGDGQRQVRVGYVVESPVWKTSYRLVVEGSGKAQLQGWAVVENTTDDDWTNVKMALVSGRPISYQMDLYPPLYVPRPTIEPERFASLRPPTYGGAMTAPAQGGLGVLGALGGLGAGGGIAGGAGGAGVTGGNNQTNLGFGGGNQNNLGMPFNRYQLAGQWGMQGGYFSVMNNANTQVDENETPGRKLTFEQLQQRKEQAKQSGKAIAMLDASASIASVASAEEIGDVCQYAIDDKLTLPRQKSAMLPIVRQAVDASKVSIFNESVHAKYPLLGLRFKNTAARPLMQGPVTVYEGASYAGDSRIADLQPGEERLLSYAMDLGTEVKSDGRSEPDVLDAVKVVKGVLMATHRHRQTRSYLIRNRSSQERTLLVEHPVRVDWKLVAPDKPVERSRDMYRFAIAIPAGQSNKLEVIEEQRSQNQVRLGQTDETTLRVFQKHSVPSAQLKEALDKLIAIKGRLIDVQRDLFQAQDQLTKVVEDQTRVRANFEKLPPTSAAYKRFLEKFDTQESEIEKLQAAVKEKKAAEKALRQEFEDFAAGLNVDA